MNEFKMNIKKSDVILVISVLAAALFFIMGMRLWQSQQSTGRAEVVVSIAGDEYLRLPLDEDRTERIDFENGDFNTLVISDGYAEISEASCPDQICVKHMHIRYMGETIVCLPNKFVVEIAGGEESDIDGSTY